MRFLRRTSDPVEAIQWNGGDTDCLDTLCGYNWGRADVKEVPWNHPDKEEVVVFNSIEKCWIPVPVGHWIISGVRGELYPCAPDIFAATYEPVASTTESSEGT